MRRYPRPVREQPLKTHILDLFALLAGPPADGRELILEQAAPLRLRPEIANGGRALLGHERPVLVGMDRVASRKHGWPSELGITHLVTVEAALLKQLIAGA